MPNCSNASAHPALHVEIQDFTQLLRDFIRGDYRTKVMRLDPLIPRAEKVVPVFESMGEDKVRVT
jgi:hypothetical protein